MMSETEIEIIWRFLASLTGASVALALVWAWRRRHRAHPGCHLVVPDSPKMLRETLCIAQSRIAHSGLDKDRSVEHVARLGRLIDECDRHRPIGPDGNHGSRHTPTCGCER